ncbi:MAG: VWA domain-containing protein [Lachnospiraceae bacterium]|nr:VWA domain-containing protein [Lachnospiraceae bacterium]
MNTQKGQRDKLEKYLNVNQEMEVVMNIAGGAVYDFSCFGLDAQGKLSDDAYMVFYNQPQSPNREVRYQAAGTGAQFFVNLNQLPEKIQKLAFTVSIDGAGNMGMIGNHVVQIRQNNQTILELALSGADFQQETAIISMEVYKKDVWRFSMTASGFNGGLGDLLRNYGGEEAEEPAVAQSAPAQSVMWQSSPMQSMISQGSPMQPVVSQSSPMQSMISQGSSMQPTILQPTQAQSVTKISLEKKLEQGAPKLVSLAKPLKVELEKRNLLDCVARVALVLDISGSMSQRYKNGTVQEIVNKTLPLAVQFDDDGELDFWYYGTTCRKMPSVNMQNYESAVPADWKQLMRTLGGSNNEVLVMEDIMREYKGSRLPIYVLFITDGGVSRAGAIKKILKKASTEPVFWQFVGVGGSNYGVLEKLDTMEGRYVDNANFFALDDFKKVSNPDLYGRLLNEFPQWLKEIRSKGMIS